ncbi:hypothetical protein [Shewanella surugensis]|uniref:Uncharacterized protein n=1 Tax=Shewanella surugensis TaxID=212020 RepID=A0ABT0LCB5_9GAMM|nr:hypothetical protein [Shewanella surugensis]MCL1125341.1 hypothetical protein [Shewanella surugensis]
MDYLLRRLVGSFMVLIGAGMPVSADEIPWSGEIAVSYLTGIYSGDTIKDDLNGYGIKSKFKYLDDYDISVGYSRSGIAFDSDDYNNTLYQDAFQFEVSSHYFVDSVNGTLTPSVQFSKIGGNLSDSALGGLTYMGGILRYMSYEQNLYGDIHYSKSDYDLNIEVYQYDISVGGSLFGPANWGQVRLYDIESQSFDRRYFSADFLVKHWLSAYSLLSPDNIYFAFTLGDRLLAVDPDTLVIANLSQIQKQYIRAGAEWALPNQSHLSLALAYSEYELSTSGSDYSGTFLFLQYSKKW